MQFVRGKKMVNTLVLYFCSKINLFLFDEHTQWNNIIFWIHRAGSYTIGISFLCFIFL